MAADIFFILEVSGNFSYRALFSVQKELARVSANPPRVQY